MQARLPDQRVLFASWHRQKDIKALNKMLLGLWIVMIIVDYALKL
jgi:hypothetical protein